VHIPQGVVHKIALNKAISNAGTAQPLYQQTLGQGPCNSDSLVVAPRMQEMHGASKEGPRNRWSIAGASWAMHPQNDSNHDSNDSNHSTLALRFLHE
jgi:hypothetical protein